MIHQRTEPSWRSQAQLEPPADPHQSGSMPHSPQLPVDSRPNISTPTSGHRNQENPPLGQLPLSVRGIVLVPVGDLPTGSGKTVVMELAICRLLNVLKDERFKVVYQAPTKSLCSERFRDWNTKFAALDLRCAELTGDTDHTQLRSISNSEIIITTPEKWDSMTRKWKDHIRLMQLVKLLLIDEVHILKETRGATLEAVVSRMKNIGSNVRFVALSATVPNSEDFVFDRLCGSK